MTNRDLEAQWGNFRDLVTHMFGEAAHTCPESDVVWYPATDVYQTPDTLVVRMDLSGIRREDMHIAIHGDILEVRGIRRDVLPHGPRRFHTMEIAVGPFHRRLRLPETFATGEASAAYRDGILEIRLEARRRRNAAHLEIVIEETS